MAREQRELGHYLPPTWGGGGPPMRCKLCGRVFQRCDAADHLRMAHGITTFGARKRKPNRRGPRR